MTKVTLSARQEQVLQMLIDGYRQTDIARELGIANAGVSMHLGKAAKKFGIPSLSGNGQAELFRIARVYFVRGQPATAGTSPEVLVASGSSGDQV
jgi:DNA-binding CsgD family transcriptional regulator